MKTIDRIIIFFLVMYSISACVKPELVEELSSIELTATMEYDAETKTSLSGLENGMYYPLWSAGDEIAVFVDGASEPSKFTLNSGEGTTVASFTGTEEGERYVALYPYDMAESLSDGTITMTLPQTQKYIPDSFGQGSFPMIATGGSDGSLKFMNLCSVLKITLNGKTMIRSITVTANDEDIFLSGLVTVIAEYGGAPFMIMTEGGSHSVTLECEGVEVSGEEDFHIVVPAQTYMNGLTIEIDTYSEVITRKIDSDLIFERSNIRHLKNLELNQDLDEQHMRMAREKAALISIYEALNGDEWLNNENWCSDRPLNEWYGVNVDTDGFVTGLSLGDASGNLNDIHTVGYIPDEILDLSGLKALSVNYARLLGNPLLTVSKIKGLEFLGLDQCNISCDFPEELCELTDLYYLSLHYNDIRGGIPSYIGNLQKLEYLRVGDNKNLSGNIPESIGNLSKLKDLELCFCGLSGKIPSSLGNLSELRSLNLRNNQLTSEIPEALSNLLKLEQLDLSWNQLSGHVPSWIATLKLRELALCNNRFSGQLPVEFQDMEIWPYMWGKILYSNFLNFSSVSIPALDFDVVDINGKELSSSEVYENNKCIAFIKWDPDIVRYDESISSTGKDGYLVELNRLYELYHDRGFDVIGYCESYCNINDVKQVISEYDIKWSTFIIGSDNFFEGARTWEYPFNAAPAIFAVNSDKEIGYFHSDFVSSVGSDPFNSLHLKDYVETELGESLDHYRSVDYSADGMVECLQSASLGNGIDIVLMGDGYSDRQIADGTYSSDMKYVYDHLFDVEPYRSFANLFNVYMVNVVSRTEGFEYKDTALRCGFKGGTEVGGYDYASFAYAQNAISASRMDNAVVVVVMNSNEYAGTCYMYYPEHNNDYGSGSSVAYFPKGDNPATFAQLLHHEANGHGFAKLADEYAYDYMGEIPSPVADENRRQQNDWGWWKNVDFTSDVTQVRWANFIEDERYADEGLGAYEGGLTYWSGVWRPTENSIMRYNTGGFNAPSREAIYYRIHKLAYGEDWEYDYEKFVEYDAINRAAAAGGPQKRRANYVEKQYEPLHPPVVVGKTWREAVK